MGSIYTDKLVHGFKTDKCVINQEGLLTKKMKLISNIMLEGLKHASLTWYLYRTIMTTEMPP